MSDYIIYNGELCHHGVKGMRWGHRKSYNNIYDSSTGKMKTNRRGDSQVTKNVKQDYNKMSDSDFRLKYGTSKQKYAKRVAKYGDPYKNSKLSKMGKKLDTNGKWEKQEVAYGKHIDKTLNNRNKKAIALGVGTAGAVLMSIGDKMPNKSMASRGATYAGAALTAIGSIGIAAMNTKQRIDDRNYSKEVRRIRREE